MPAGATALIAKPRTITLAVKTRKERLDSLADGAIATPTIGQPGLPHRGAGAVIRASSRLAPHSLPALNNKKKSNDNEKYFSHSGHSHQQDRSDKLFPFQREQNHQEPLAAVHRQTVHSRNQDSVGQRAPAAMLRQILLRTAACARQGAPTDGCGLGPCSGARIQSSARDPRVARASPS